MSYQANGTYFSVTDPFNTGIGDNWMDKMGKGGMRSLWTGPNAADAALGADYVQRLRDLAGYTTTGKDGEQYFVRSSWAPTFADGEGGGAGGGGVNSVYDLLGKSGTVTPGEQLWGVSKYNPEADDITDYNGYTNDGYDSDGNFLSSNTMVQTGDKGFMKNMITNLAMVLSAGAAGGLFAGAGMNPVLAAEGLGGAAGGAGGAAAGAGGGWMNGVGGEAIAGGDIAAGGGGILTGGAPSGFVGAGGAGTAGGGGLSSLFGGGGGMGTTDWLRLGGGLLGALGGSQGNETTTTTNRELPPYLADRVPGLLGDVDALRNFQLYGQKFGKSRKEKK